MATNRTSEENMNDKGLHADNLIVISGRYGEEVEVNLDDLDIEPDYEAQLYHPPMFVARKRYTTSPAHDVHNEYYRDAIWALLEIVQSLNKRLRRLEQRTDMLATDSPSQDTAGKGVQVSTKDKAKE